MSQIERAKWISPSIVVFGRKQEAGRRKMWAGICPLGTDQHLAMDGSLKDIGAVASVE
jgi:hypothetical protein